MNDCLTAKRAFAKGLHSPLWGDRSHYHYNPEAIRVFYWRKMNVQIYGINWLSQASTIPIPSGFRPPEYLAAL